MPDEHFYENPMIDPPSTLPELPADASPEDEKQAVQRRMAIARNRMVRRLFEVGRRVEHAKESLDVAQFIRQHPLAVAGGALGAGALLGLMGGGRGSSGGGGGGLFSKVTGLVGALALAAAKDSVGAYIKRALIPPLSTTES